MYFKLELVELSMTNLLYLMFELNHKFRLKIQLLSMKPNILTPSR